MKALNERLALWAVNGVATMACAYVFAIIALIALPQAIGDSFSNGFHPLPLVAWTSQSLLQLVLLSVIMVGQDIQAREVKMQAGEQHDAVLEILNDMREVLTDVRELTLPTSTKEKR